METQQNSLRQMVVLTDRQKDHLSAEANRIGVKIPEVIRRVLDQWIDAKEVSRHDR